MLFSSYDFVFFFLPAVLFLSYFIKKFFDNEVLILFLLFASVLFYGWSDFSLLIFLMGSIVVNAVLSNMIDKTHNKIYLFAAIAFNLGVLGYYKYLNFFIENVHSLLPFDISIAHIALPLGISFYTFQQIGYQVDIYKGIAKPTSFVRYALFVSFFPQLIAGPIVHYKNFLPQMQNFLITKQSLAVGMTLFTLGLAKKVLIADKLAPLVNYYYSNIGHDGFSAGMIDTWFSVIAYSFQLYFDFAGYADMALGIGLCFSIILPINFFSPYKATSLTDFWRRWHITLHDFLKSYVYIPLGGSRTSDMGQVKNILITMLLGGLWHGAGWTFIIWGGVSGLIIGLEKLCSYPQDNIGRAKRLFKTAITFFIITLLWIPFRANSLDEVMHIFKILFGQTDILLGSALHEELLYGSLEKGILSFSQSALPFPELHYALVWIGLLGACALLTFFLPNTAQIFSEDLKITEHNPKLAQIENKCAGFTWKPNVFWLIFTAILMLSVTIFMKRQVEFLYFQF